MAAHVDLKPMLYTGRVYLDGDTKSYTDKKPFDAVFTLSRLEDGRAFISGMHGNLNREAMRAILSSLASEGFQYASMERHGELLVLDCKTGRPVN